MKWTEKTCLIYTILGSIILAVLFAASILYIHQREQAYLRAETYQITKDPVTPLIHELEQSNEVVTGLAHLVITTRGNVQEFDRIARHTLETHQWLANVQLAPNGVVTTIYPEKGNENGKIDLLNDPKRGPVVRYGLEQNMIIAQGPLPLKQGGLGIAVRKPVFLMSETDRTMHFWGFTIAMIAVPEIYINTVYELSREGYDYRLIKQAMPTSSDMVTVSSTTEAPLKNPVTYTFYWDGCEWTLEAAPTGGWQIGSYTKMGILIGISLWVLLTIILYGILKIDTNERLYRHAAETDPLTGLYNRRGFNEHIDAYLKSESHIRGALAMLDVDNFKFFNDTYGHHIGDMVLLHLSQTLRRKLGNRSIIGRNGGDEFIFLIRDISEEAAVRMIRDLSETKQTFSYKGTDYVFTISIGFACFPRQAIQRESLCRCADIALYAVKLQGRDSFAQYHEKMNAMNRSQFGTLFRDITALTPVGTVICQTTTKDWSVLYANAAQIALYGCQSLKEFLDYCGDNILRTIHPDDRKSFREMDSEIHGYFRILTRQGSYVKVLITAHRKHPQNFDEIAFIVMQVV